MKAHEKEIDFTVGEGALHNAEKMAVREPLKSHLSPLNIKIKSRGPQASSR